MVQQPPIVGFAATELKVPAAAVVASAVWLCNHFGLVGEPIVQLLPMVGLPCHNLFHTASRSGCAAICGSGIEGRRIAQGRNLSEQDWLRAGNWITTLHNVMHKPATISNKGIFLHVRRHDTGRRIEQSTQDAVISTSMKPRNLTCSVTLLAPQLLSQQADRIAKREHTCLHMLAPRNHHKNCHRAKEKVKLGAIYCHHHLHMIISSKSIPQLLMRTSCLDVI